MIYQGFMFLLVKDHQFMIDFHFQIGKNLNPYLTKKC